MPKAPVILCVLLWAREGREVDLAAYEDDVLTLVTKHGGVVRQRLANIGSEQSAPAEVQVIEFPTEVAFTAYLDDPHRAAMAERRDRAIARTEIVPVRDA